MDEGRGSRILPSVDSEGSSQSSRAEERTRSSVKFDVGSSFGKFVKIDGFWGVVNVKGAVSGVSKIGFLRLGCVDEGCSVEACRVGVERGDGVRDGSCRCSREEEGWIERREARGAGVGVVSTGSNVGRHGRRGLALGVSCFWSGVMEVLDGSSISSHVDCKPPGEGIMKGILEILTQFWRLWPFALPFMFEVLLLPGDGICSYWNGSLVAIDRGRGFTPLCIGLPLFSRVR